MIMFLVKVAVMYVVLGIGTMMAAFIYGIYRVIVCKIENVEDDPVLQEYASQFGGRVEDANTEVEPIAIIACYILTWPVILFGMISAVLSAHSKQGQR